MEARGYKGAFMAKCSSPAESYGFQADGCALFYRKSRFRAVGAPDGADYYHKTLSTYKVIFRRLMGPMVLGKVGGVDMIINLEHGARVSGSV